MKTKDTKTLIIETAYELFHQYNYQSVTVMDICDACQITKPTFYKYIDSKDSLLKYYFRSMASVHPEGWFEVDDSINYYDRIVETYKHYFQNIDDMGFKLYREVIISNLKDYIGSYNDSVNFNSTLEEWIRSAQRLGQIRNMADPHRLMSATIALSVGMAGYKCMFDDAGSLFGIFEEGLRCMLEPVKEEVCDVQS